MDVRVTEPLRLSMPPPKLKPVLGLEGLPPNMYEGEGLVGSRLFDVADGEKTVEGNEEFMVSPVVLVDSVPLRVDFESRLPKRLKNELWEVDADVSDGWAMEESEDSIISVLVVLVSVPLPLGSVFKGAGGNADGGWKGGVI